MTAWITAAGWPVGDGSIHVLWGRPPRRDLALAGEPFLGRHRQGFARHTRKLPALAGIEQPIVVAGQSRAPEIAMGGACPVISAHGL